MDRRIDRRLGALLERLGRGPDFQDACTAVLHHLLVSRPAGRGLIVARAGDLVRGSGWRVEPGLVRAAEAAARDRDSPLARRLNGGGPGDGAMGLDDLRPSLLLDFESGGFEGRGVLLAEGLEGEGDESLASEVLDRCSPFLVRALELEALRARVAHLEKERTLRSRMVEAIPDPMLLTDAEANIVTANDRAHQLFFSGPDDSEGRARAVRLNAFLLSARLTEAAIPGAEGTRRELNLVDPADGSDLLFEMGTERLADKGSEGGFLITVLRDVTEVKRASEELGMEFNRSRAAEHRARQESRRLQAILENVAEPILVTDPRSRIVLMNREAEHLFEVREYDQGPEERAPVRWRNVSRLSSFVSDLTLGGKTRTVETLVLLHPTEGEEFPVEATAVKLEDERGEVTAVVTVLRDLTPVVENERLAQALRALNQALEGRIERATAELEERNRILEWQGRELERASQLKSQFLANMSHELRTPINAMLGYVSLLQEGIFGSMNEGQVGALEKMESAAEHLLDLINDILDLSRIEAGKMPVRSDRVDLSALVSELGSTVELLIGDRPLEFVTDVSDDLASMQTDRTKLRQVLLNLLENAVKFTEEGSVSLRILPGKGHDRIRMEVEDTGIGMSAEELEHVFEDFRQGDQTRSRAHGGAGLGLSISRRLVALLGGRISVESEVGTGTTFAVDLPRVLAPPAHGPAQVRASDDELPGAPAKRGPAASDAAGSPEDEDSRSDISHGLKNPLQGIVGYAELMEMGRYGELDPSVREVVEKIADHGRQMSGRLDVAMGLLTLAAGAAREPTAHTVSLSEAARHAARRLFDEATERGTDLEIAIDDVGLEVPGTPDRLVTLVLALLRLGMERAGPGRLRLVAEDGDDGTVALRMERERGPEGERAGPEDALDGTRLEQAVLRLLVEGVGGRVEWHEEEADPVPEVWLPVARVRT